MISAVTIRVRQQERTHVRSIRQIHVPSTGNNWTTCMFTNVMQPNENHSFFTILEKIIWGSFNQLLNNNMTFEKTLLYQNQYNSKIKELGVIHHLYLHHTIKCYNEITKKGIYQKIIEVMHNPFISSDDKQRFFNIFSSCQKHYLALCRFAFICKFKRAKIGCDTDMYMNPISKNGCNYVELLHENRKYVFTIPDLTKIIRKSLNTSSDMYSDPQTIKNPYNNLSFTKSDLYTIYFAIKKSDYNIPTVFQQYFYSNFSLTRLIDDFEPSLREAAIRDACITNDDECICELKENILDMIEIYNDTHSEMPLSIHDNFPEKNLLETFKPFMKHYYRSMYSLNNSEKSRSRIYWLASMKKFASENPSFGRKVTKIKSDLSGKKRSLVEYNTNVTSHISPYNYNCEAAECHMKLIEKESDFVVSYRTNIKRAAEQREQREQRSTTHVFRNLATQSISNRNNNNSPFDTLLNSLAEFSLNYSNNEVVNRRTISSDDSSTSSDEDDGLTVNLFGPETNNENMRLDFNNEEIDEYEDDLERETESIS
jgi:hypothetical protein